MSSNPDVTAPVTTPVTTNDDTTAQAAPAALDPSHDLVLFTKVVGILLAAGLVAILVYALQDISHFLSVATTGILIAAASLALGLLAGFIFGIPTAPKEEAPANQATQPASPAVPVSGQANGGAGPGQQVTIPNFQPYRPNTTMEKISEWLATILVGIGLTQLLKVPAALESFGNRLKPALGNTDAAVWVAVGVLLLYAVIGFLTGFLWTRVKIPELYALSDLRQKWINALSETRKISSRAGEVYATEKIGRSLAKTPPDLVPKEVLPAVSEGGEAPRRRQILWVDDQPDNNIGLRELIKTRVSADIEICTSSDEALKKDITKYDLVISDMSRPWDRHAGISLLRDLGRKGFSKPYLIYAGRVVPSDEQTLMGMGGYGITASPVQLLSLVESALKN